MNYNVSELICTRISHDLIGNIGAVANAVELLEEGDMDFLSDIHSILKISSSTLSARLKFFRMAFGVGNANIENIALVNKTINEYLATIGGKNPPLADINFENIKYSKAIMLAVMALGDLLIRGGTIFVVEKNNQVLVGIEKDAKIAEDKLAQTIKVLHQTADNLSAQDVPLLYLLDVCKNNNIKLGGQTSPSLCFVLE
ncbi:MAG: hypothetical protein E7019_06900 [Alphaproteobacteria bacterium]|nr:hypothetical protein [Alphaproteobacteria bacterium]